MLLIPQYQCIFNVTSIIYHAGSCVGFNLQAIFDSPYGYDLQRRELKIIDHNYRNSFQYVEKVVSMDNILYANKMFGSGVLNRKTTCHVLMRKKLSRSVDKSFILQRYGAQIYEESRNNTMENLNQLKILIDGNVSALQERSDKITRYLQEMKNH